MNKHLIFILAILLAGISSINGQNSDIILIENVNIIPMNEETVLEQQRVVISNGKILKIEPVSINSTYKPKLTIDGTGKYLIPGLSEMHYHWRNNESGIVSDLKLLIANGVTTVRNMAEYQGQDHIAIRQKIQSGTLLGPNYFTAGPYLKLDQLKTKDLIIQVVKKHKDRGYDFLKIADNLPQDIYIALLEEAHKNNITVIGHAQRKLPLEYSLRMKSIEHVEEFIYLNNGDEHYSYLNNNIADLNQTAQQIKTSGVYVAPTLVVFDFLTKCLNDVAFKAMQNHDLVKYLPPGERDLYLTEKNLYRKNLKHIKYDGIKAEILFKDYFIWMKKFTRILSDHGVPLLTGSDTFGMVIVGFSLHKEFEFLQEAGIKPYDILRASTVNPARYLNRYSLEGTITEGKNANLVLLNKNPLDDIRNTKTINGVMLKGKWLNRKQLDSMLSEVESAYK